MSECTDQRQKCQELLGKLKKSQDLLKSQLGNSTANSYNISQTLPTYDLGSFSLKHQSHPGILKTSSIGPRSLLSSSRPGYNSNNSATIDNDPADLITRRTGRNLSQGISNMADTSYSDAGGLKGAEPSLSGRRLYDSTASNATKTSNIADTTSKSLYDTATSEYSTLSRHTSNSTSNDKITSPSKSWREILDRHVKVPSQLNSQELRELENLRSLKYNYSPLDVNVYPEQKIKEDTLERQTSSSRAEPQERKVVETTICKDITNKPVSVSLSNIASKVSSKQDRSLENERPIKSLHSNDRTNSKKVQFFRDQLEDEGNSRKLNSFIKETTIKPKSLLNSTGYRSLCPKQNSPEMSAEDQRLLGYDWIAALLDNDSDNLVNQSESFFNELKDFRRAFKSECSNQFYRETPHTLVEFEPEPVVEALKETKVHPYIVNERLFTQPFKSGLIDYQDEEERKPDQREKKTPTEDNPRFVRVSIPRSTLSTPYKVKPHRRRSFDGSDSCSLMDHCLLGWENSRPAMIPTAKSLDLNTEAGTRIDSQITTLNEAERLAAKFSEADWPFSRPTARMNTLPTWRKHYMDTTLNLSMLSTLGSQANNSATSNSTAMNASSGSGVGSSKQGGGGIRDVKRSTDRILSATYSAMYEMERLRKERELEMAAMKNS